MAAMYGDPTDATSPQTPQGGPHPIKISQRASKSCTECVRRKARCDKTIPCSLCIKRGVTHLCRLEPQFIIPDTSPSVGGVAPSELESLRESVNAELESLRQRVAELERTAAATAHERSLRATSVGSRPSLSGEPDIATEDAATTLEFFALGVDRREGPERERVQHHSNSRAASSTLPVVQRFSHLDHVQHEPYDRPMPESVMEALLPRENVQSILRFAEQGGWQHVCVFFPRLWEELEAFYTAVSVSWDLVDPTWVALLFVLKGIAIHQMTDRDAEACGLAEGDRYVLPTALMSAAEDALYAGQFLSRPTMWTVQVCAILSTCGHNVCDSALLSSLLAIGIKTAQALNLHGLGKPSRHLERAPSGSTPDRVRKVIDVEVGKRLWWALAQQDWFIIPYRGVWSIHPEHFDTGLPNNCHDQDLADGLFISRPDSTATVAYKMRMSAQVASVLQRFFQELNHRQKDTPFATAEGAVNKIQQLLQSMPLALQPDPPPGVAQPPWAPITRHYLHISSRHKSLVIYRAFLTRGGGTTQERARAHEVCIELAERILAEFERGRQLGDLAAESGQTLWTIPYHALAAAVVLSIDLIALNGKQPEAAKRLQAVMSCKVSLERLAPTSRIARRGIQVLNDLLQEAEQAASGSGKRQASTDLGQVVKKLRLPVDQGSTSGSDTSTPRRAVFPVVNASPQQLQGAVAPGPSTQWPPPPTYPTLLEFSNDDTNALLASLHSVPEISQLFDGTIGAFNWP